MNKRGMMIAFGLIFVVTAVWIVFNRKETIQQQYTLLGEGPYWKAEYQVQTTETFLIRDKTTAPENDSKKRFILTYKGELSDLSGLRELKYAFTGSSADTKETVTFESPPNREIVVNRMDRTLNGALEQPDPTLEVTVEWNGTQETFRLSAK